MKTNKSHPSTEGKKKVLISYCQQDHSPGYIADLAYKLEARGFRVTWDGATNWDGAPTELENHTPEDWEKWFGVSVNEQDFVLIVFSERYKKCYETPIAYQAHFKTIGSMGIYSEIEFLKGILSGTSDSKLAPGRIVSVFRGISPGKQLIRRRELIPTGRGGGKTTFCLDTQLGGLVAFLKKNEPPKDFAKKSWLSRMFAKTLYFLFAANERLSQTARAIGLLILSGLLVGLISCFSLFHNQIAEFLNIATLTQQNHINSGFAITNSSLGRIETNTENAIKVVGEVEIHVTEQHKASNSHTEMLIQETNKLVRDIKPSVDLSEVIKRVDKLQNDFLVPQFAETLEAIEAIPDLDQIKAAIGEDGKITRDSVSKCCLEADKKLNSVIEKLVLMRFCVEKIKKQTNPNVPIPGDPEEVSQGNGEGVPSFPTEQCWYFYNRAQVNFFSGDYQNTVRLLDLGIGLGNDDGRLYLLRCLANRRQGYAFESDLWRAIALERQNRPSKSTVNRSLERIQGEERLWLEEQRKTFSRSLQNQSR